MNENDKKKKNLIIGFVSLVLGLLAVAGINSCSIFSENRLLKQNCIEKGGDPITTSYGWLERCLYDND